MPVNLTIDADIAEALRVLGVDDRTITREIAEAVADDAVLPSVREYAPKSGKKQPFVSAKQRRYFFAALKKGKIKVPYPRTNKLKGGWGKQPFTSGVRVVNTVGYAELVMGEGEAQARYHRGNWQTVDEIARNVEDHDAQRIGTRAVQDLFTHGGTP